ncbi:expressed protein [Chlorella variabilis]|uniref:Expressed protein n=1 Tax=Chlorella variabilis TaxID=554065 RepID=E1Z2R4_CHLVA|nr:expressed protein [Chlorella variabilis]EFN60042.1 expressed protein [Chlorella variabilis]|eukprot:XP_005852144.1 expressed protein [Chlorella variabilis]
MLLRQAVQCSQAGQGFGESSGKRSTATKGGKRRKDAGIKSGDSKAVQRAVRLVEQQEGKGRGPPSARPIDPREAARGKVEYVKVKDWGSGQPEDLGSLQVEDGSKVFEAGGGSGSGEAPPQPFYESLARRLELLQTQGALGVAQPQGSKPLPDFQRWAFALEHYVQYLADMHAVHAALESSIAGAAAQVSASSLAGLPQQRREQLLQALGLFGAARGLDRAAPLLQDLRRLAARQQQQEASRGGGGGAAQGEYSPPPAMQHAAAYAAYLASLARACRASEGPDELEQVVLRLLANAYILRLMHHTSGGRIAAAAAQKLDLASAGALAFHQSYPGLDARLGPGAKPLEALVGDTNRLGEELGKAMTKTSMLLVPLAQEA